MIRLFYAMPIDKFVEHLVLNDRDVAAIYSKFELEKDEIIEHMTAYFHHMGIYIVEPLEYAELIREELLRSLPVAPTIQARRREIRQQIKRAREKNRRS